MGQHITIAGIAGKIEARALRMRNAVAAELERVADAKRPKPKPAQRRTFAHIRDYREFLK